MAGRVAAEGKTLQMAVGFGFYRCGFEGYLGKIS